MLQGLTVMSVAQILTERPGLLEAVRRLGIDPFCEARTPLCKLCADHRLELREVANQLRAEACADGEDCSPEIWRRLIGQTIEHIKTVHHTYTRRQLPIISDLLTRVAQKHAAQQPRLLRLRDLFLDYAHDLELHMDEEEQQVFPACPALLSRDRAAAHAAQQPLMQMLADHGEAGHAMETMRAWTEDFADQPNGSSEYNLAMQALRELEADLHRHVHEENNLLFPIAMRLMREPSFAAG